MDRLMVEKAIKLRRAAQNRHQQQNGAQQNYAGCYLANNSDNNNMCQNSPTPCLYENTVMAPNQRPNSHESSKEGPLGQDANSELRKNQSSSNSQYSQQPEDLKPHDLSDVNNVTETAKPEELTSGVKKNPCSTLNSLESTESCPHASTKRSQGGKDNGAYSSGERHRYRASMEQKTQKEPSLLDRDNRLPARDKTHKSMMINDDRLMDSRHNIDGVSISSSGSVNKGHTSDKRRSKRGDDMDRTNHEQAIVANGANLSSIHDGTAHSASPLGNGSGQVSTDTRDGRPQNRAPEVEQEDAKKASRLRQPGVELEHITQSQVKPLQSRPVSNLIRRDDSWQSLVSLTRAGKETPTRGSALQVTQRSLYAQHIMPKDDPNNHHKELMLSETHRRNLINIESTVTPIRGGRLLRHQLSMQSRKMRPLPPIGDKNYASFDDACAAGETRARFISSATPLQNHHHLMSPLQARSGANDANRAYKAGLDFKPPLTHHQKLLQLQLLHNSNNVDYIRNNNGYRDDYNQIYACDTNSNHYGYYSMRSNLKSAASEFSFIRPSPSTNVNPQANFTNQQNNHSYILNKSHQARSFDNNQNHFVDRSMSQVPNRQFALEQSAIPGVQVEQYDLPQDSSCVPHMMNNSPATDVISGVPTIAPNRELPLKPSKRKDGHLSSASGIKNSSLTSGIVSFFRRAFSRRRRTNKKLAESCSSSMVNFDDRHPFASNMHALPSAFSTGGKSIDATTKQRQSPDTSDLLIQSQQQQQQQQRMIDMVEAFKNKAISDEDAIAVHKQYIATHHTNHPHRLASMSFYGQPNQLPVSNNHQQQQQMANHAFNRSISPNQFGSPLHKSNSMSASMGFGTLRDVIDGGGRCNLFRDDEFKLMSPHEVPRSTKVLSANLTPIRGFKDECGDQANSRHQLQRSVMSPRRPMRNGGNNGHVEHLPRPSSIYGQPSLVTPPMMITPERGSQVAAFGLHRGSLHSHIRDRDRGVGPIHLTPGGGGGSALDARRHHHHNQMKKIPCLDTTREVAEEISSPTTEHHHMPFGYNFDSNAMQTPSHSNSNSNRQAIVNPILQSPCAIYDNHIPNAPHCNNQSQGAIDTNNPMVFDQVVSSSSHYDNSPNPEMAAAYSLSRRGPGESLYQHQHQIQHPGDGRATVADMMLNYNKPAAIIAPNMPDRRISDRLVADSAEVHRNLNPYQRSSMRSSQQPEVAPNRSSMINGRAVPRADEIAFESQYQQHRSPRIVNSQTRILSQRPVDGIAPISADKYDDSGFGSGDYGRHRKIEMADYGSSGEPVVNIAGAPGINVDPSLAAALLRGTNIDAYESSTNYSQQNNSGNRKTFLVATRLSKSMVQQDDCSPSRRLSGQKGPEKDDRKIPDAKDASIESSREASSSSSGSRSTNGSNSDPEWKLPSRRSDSIESRNNDDRKSFGSTELQAGNQPKSPHNSDRVGDRTSGNGRPKGPSMAEKLDDSNAEQSDENSIDNVLDEPEERNWITSKLVE